MGVPKLFHSLIQQYHHNDVSNPTGFYIIQKEIENNLPTHLYFDFNSAIYQVITTEIKTPETLILYTVQYLETLCQIIPNLELVYVALDGVPPFGKIKNQRERRFHSIAKSNRTRAILSTYGANIEKEKFIGNVGNCLDTNMITPGTTFMYELGIAIRKKLSELAVPGGLLYRKRVIFSDSSIPGEGEHKIIHYIRSQKNVSNIDIDSLTYNTVIYALDNDLIMLALTLQCENIFLFREADQYGEVASMHAGKPYLFMNIKELKEALITSWGDTYGCCKIDTPEKKHRYIDDYIFLGMLLGNDFMPKTHWFSIAEGGIERLLSAYWQIHNHTELFLVSTLDMNINTEMLGDILYLVKEQEQEAVENLFVKRQKARIPTHKAESERERQQMLVDFYPLQYLQIEKEIEPKLDGWRDRYYKTCFHLEPSNANISMITQSYLKTLVWNFHYYFNSCIAWDWSYSFSYAPTWRDIYNELVPSNKQTSQPIQYMTPMSPMKSMTPMKSMNLNKLVVSFGETKLTKTPLDTQTLLLMVLPWASRRFMAVDIVRKMEKEGEDSIMRVYFPKKYGLNVAFHRYYHECTPILYKMNIDKVMQFVNGCKLTESELNRNLVGNLFEINM